jgi:hypothetical protein
MLPHGRKKAIDLQAFEPGDEEAFRPYRRLALRVLERALLDLTAEAGSISDRESAQLFLASSRMLVLWCQIAGLDPSHIVRRVETLTTLRTRGHAAARWPLVIDRLTGEGSRKHRPVSRHDRLDGRDTAGELDRVALIHHNHGL